MAQLTIYLPDDLERKARKAAKAKGTSVSRWIAEQVVQSIGETWPKGVLEAAGALPDFPSLDQIRKGYGKDAPRERLDAIVEACTRHETTVRFVQRDANVDPRVILATDKS